MSKADDSEPKIGRQDLGETQLPYLLYEGEGPPLVLLHATGFSAWLWHPLARALAPSFRIFVPFFCDHRRMDPYQGGIPWTLLAQDLVRFCEALGLESPFLAGHSMGATVSLIAHAHAGLPASALLLIEPILLPQAYYRSGLTVEEHPFAVKALQRTNFWRDRSEARAFLQSRAFFQGWDEEVLELYLRHGLTGAEGGGLRLACDPQQEAALFMGGAHFDPWPLLPKVSCPTLLLEGEKGEHRWMLDFDRMRSLLPACEHRLVKGGGHLAPMERPDAVVRQMETFMRPLRTGRVVGPMKAPQAEATAGRQRPRAVPC